MTETATYLWATAQLPTDYDYLAPDGSEIRLLPEVGGGGLAHCTLPVNSASSATYHKTVDEIWYFISGVGEVWRKRGRQETVDIVEAGICLNIPCGTSFQFRNTGHGPLCFVIATIPRWPGAQESVATEGHWSNSAKQNE
jgi:mannose-6-phosphate isomerase-like protein (cupin superfamily)